MLGNGFEPGKVLDLLERHRITHMFLVPTKVNLLVRHPGARERDLSRMRALLIGGAPITDDTSLLAHEIFGDACYQGFGQTETGVVSIMSAAEWFGTFEGSEPLRAAGRVHPYAELEIWDEENRRLPIGSEGEIVTKSEGQMHGYWAEPELSARTIVDGWIKTGDIGRLDANGFLYVLDRADDMIISGGFNIWPAELETVITDHPAVVECAVFAAPDERWGETPVAVCVVDPAFEVSEDEIVDLVRERLGSYKKPSIVVLTQDPLPKTPVGKIQRKLLREPYWAGRERRVAGS
jgi:acyl-CoA synthetase (AMP-forming)/AMP-acid ligase II